MSLRCRHLFFKGMETCSKMVQSDVLILAFSGNTRPTGSWAVCKLFCFEAPILIPNESRVMHAKNTGYIPAASSCLHHPIENVLLFRRKPWYREDGHGELMAKIWRLFPANFIEFCCSISDLFEIDMFHPKTR